MAECLLATREGLRFASGLHQVILGMLKNGNYSKSKRYALANKQTQYNCYAQLGHPDKGRATKGLVVSWMFLRR